MHSVRHLTVRTRENIALVEDSVKGPHGEPYGHWSSWGTLRTLAQDSLRWREFVATLVVYDKKGSK